MDSLIIEHSKNTPKVLFRTNGNLLLEGRIILEDTVTFFDPIVGWMEKLEAPEVRFTIKLDYLNTSASKLLFNVLQMLSENPNIGNVKVDWYYDEDDEDHLDTGKFYEESIDNISFEYIAMSEVEIAA
jgi:hypothetical protein